MNLDDFSYSEDDRRYIKPEVSLNEQNAFIDNLRSVQEKNNAEIAQDTYNLGTDISSNLGGLVGGESYFQSRYQTPQTNSLVADLRAAAQAQALNTAMSNELAKAKKRYNNAYRAASKRAAARSTGGGGGGGYDDVSYYDPEVDYTSNDDYEKKVVGSTEFAGSQLTAEQLAKMQKEYEETYGKKDTSSDVRKKLTSNWDYLNNTGLLK